MLHDFVFNGVLRIVGRALRLALAPDTRMGRRRSRPRLSFNAAALQTRYETWAARSGLTQSPTRTYRYEGDVGGRHVVFTTGLGGSEARSPELVVSAALDVARPRLIVRSEHGDRLDDDRADEASCHAEALLAELLVERELLRSVGVTARLVRLTFEPGTDVDELERARLALDDRLRDAAPLGEPQSPFR